jgi:hypothetical protein
MNRTYTEEVDSIKVDYLKNLSDKDLLKIIEEPHKKLSKDGQINNLKSIRNYLSFCIEKDYKYKVNYSPSTNNIEGRIYSKLPMSFQSLTDVIRGFLACDNYFDIDIINAFPTIMLYICKKYGLGCKYLCEYVNNREVVLATENIDKYCIFKYFLMTDVIKPQKTFYLKNLAGEITQNKSTIINLNRELLDSLPTKNKENPNSSNLSKILEYYENKILNIALSVPKKRDIVALIFDGFIVKNIVDKNIINKINSLTEKYGVTFKIKKWNESIIIPEDYECKILDYNDYKLELEKQFAFLENPTMFIRLASKESKEVLFKNENDFRILAAPFFNKVFKFNDWIADPNRKTYKSLTFSPKVLHDDPHCKVYGDALGIQPVKEPDGAFNQALPYKAIYFKKDDPLLCDKPFNIFKQYLIDNITGEEGIDWFINFISLKLKNPNYNHKCGFILKGAEGTGKDTFIEFLNKIYGEDRDYIYNQNDEKHILGSVNTGLKNKLICVLNEMESLKGHVLIDKLKDLITRRENVIEEKYVKPYKQDNNVTLFVFSNNMNPIKLTVSNRRWILFVTKSINKGKTEYWKNLYNLMEDENFINNLFTSLMNHNITEGFSPCDSENHPRSNQYFEMVNDQIPQIIKFLYNCDYSDFDILQDGKYAGWNYTSKSEFKKLFDKYTDDNTKIKTTNILNNLDFTEEHGIVKNIRVIVNNKRLGERLLINKQLFLSVLKDKYFAKENEISTVMFEHNKKDEIDKLEYIN